MQPVAKTAGVLLAALVCGIAEVRGAEHWLVEAEGPGATRQKGATVADEAAASGGKVVALAVDGAAVRNLVVVPFPAAARPGRYQAVLRLRVEGAADLGKALRVEVRQDKELLGCRVAYGVYLPKAGGYSDFPVDCAWYAGPRPVVTLYWTGVEGKPAAWLDSVDFVRTGDLPDVRIRELRPDRLRYLATQDGEIAVTLESPTGKEVRGTVRLELTHDLDPPESLGEIAVSANPGATARVAVGFRNPGLLFGYGVRATLLVDGQEVDWREECFTVHDNPWAVATGGRDEEPGDYYPAWHTKFYAAGATDKAIEDGAENARREYMTCHEFFSWSPGECFEMAPDRPIWVRGNGGNLIRTKRELQREVAALKKRGIGCITYIAFQAMGERTVQLQREKPEWFIYSPQTADLLEFYNLGELVKHQAFWKGFDWARWEREANPEAAGWQDTPEWWKGYEEYWRKPSEEARKLSIIGYFAPNYKLPEVVDYCADQAIASARMFGWDGLRWDCGQLNTGPIWGSYSPFLDFHGQPLTKSPEEMVEQTVANLQRLKKRIRAQFPNFAIGTNYGSWMETHKYPAMTRELARDGGWLLDEMSYGYNGPTSPYHFWDRYYAIMADEGEHVTSLGGHYNPFAFNRGGGKYPVDRLYETIFRIAGKGHPNSIYFNSRSPAGNFSQFCVRFGRFVFDPQIRRIDNPAAQFTVTAPAALWWDKTVGQLSAGAAEYRIVHLINPPLAREVESDPLSRLPAPVQNVTVKLAAPPGKMVTQAWALTAEAWRSGEAPRTQAVPLDVTTTGGAAAVTLPELLYWKMIVFRLAPR